MALAQPPKYPVDARFGENLTLAGYDLSKDGDNWEITLYWKVDSAPDRPLKRFLHLVAADDSIVAQSDLPLENNGVPVTAWRSGEYVRESHRFQLQKGDHVERVCTGVYDARTEQRIPISVATGERVPDDRLCFRVKGF